jgi:hypothetical protein
MLTERKNACASNMRNATEACVWMDADLSFIGLVLPFEWSYLPAVSD